MKRILPYALPILLLNLLAGLNFWYHRQLSTLDAQLAQSVYVLTSENQFSAYTNAGLVKDLEAAVAKNRNQPADVARFRQAEALHAQVTHALRTRRYLDSLLRQAAGYATNPTGMRQPAQPIFDRGYELIDRQWPVLHRQVAACADSLRHFSPAAARPVQLPAATSGTTIVQAMADLAGTEHQLLVSEAAVLSQVSKTIGIRTLPAGPIALATAESNVVAPGDTYRAHLLPAAHLPADLRLDMRCNGQPVSVDQRGIGQVRFRAPRQSGPAVWTGTIRLYQNRRDTTFVVRVPYRVAAR